MPHERSRDLLAFALALAAAAFVIFFRLTEFPLYFFCDEAIPAVEAQSLLTTGRDRAGALWPLFIRGQGVYQLSLSVYWLLPFQALFGMSETVVRACGALASLIGAAGISFFARRIFPAGRGWALVPLVFYGAPFWYLHARTGFEVVISASAWLVVIASFGSLWRTGPSDSRSSTHEIAAWTCFRLLFLLLHSCTRLGTVDAYRSAARLVARYVRAMAARSVACADDDSVGRALPDDNVLSSRNRVWASG